MLNAKINFNLVVTIVKQTRNVPYQTQTALDIISLSLSVFKFKVV